MSANPRQPLVSIGMPVYNEQAYLELALASLRAQTYPNLEIVICDNASTDDTLAICRRHAAQDARIRIDVAPLNRGVTANFRRAEQLAEGEYFMWACGHDLWSPSLVEECVSLLEAHPEATLAYASSDWIGADGSRLDRHAGWYDTRGLGPASRFYTVLWGNMHPVLGLLRTRSLRTFGPIPPIVGGDLVFLTRMALNGHFLHARSSSWSRREFRNELSYSEKLRRYSSSSFGMAVPWLARRFPMLVLPLALLRNLAGARIPIMEKLAALAALPANLLLRLIVGRRRQDR